MAHLTHSKCQYANLIFENVNNIFQLIKMKSPTIEQVEQALVVYNCKTVTTMQDIMLELQDMI